MSGLCHSEAVGAAPDSCESGTRLNGTLPNSTTAQEVSGVEEVSCSASDAHYQVIETIPFTSDMSRCNNNPRTEYAFSSRYTLNGATINEHVYCLIGLGSYAQY
ncbi:LppU/SCO3897 family protein [Streptomyces sp. HC307]|uniref:LppU/SCO3897 family protein n=1 Tax=Streptomyces flavusporus TaxID=3385496 RepID=UPI003916D0A3